MAGRGGRDPILRLERVTAGGEALPRPAAGSGVLSFRPASRVGLDAWLNLGDPGRGRGGAGSRDERAAGSPRGVAPVRAGPAAPNRAR